MLFDTHAHLDYPEFEADLDALLERAAQAGVSRIISIGTNLESSRRAIALAERHSPVFAVAGWHPCEAMEAPDDIRTPLRELAKHPKVVALGETGLDYYRMPSKETGNPADDDHYRHRQAELFRQHLDVAVETGLNVVIHQRASFADTLAQLTPFADRVRGVFHCFAEPVDSLHRVLALGSIVSYTGILTFKNGQNIRDALAATPMDRFMLETDSPYLAPVPYRGKRCEPAYVMQTAIVAAQVKGCPLEEIADATSETALAFFPKLH
ncbi:MAG TPA: TatD family deoxyribonuclease [Verrucomicrobiales bacterium]|nr:TatD family deoxyribonuclease [Verrucomicrobiales bacterium]